HEILPRPGQLAFVVVGYWREAGGEAFERGTAQRIGRRGETKCHRVDKGRLAADQWWRRLPAQQDRRSVGRGERPCVGTEALGPAGAVAERRATRDNGD